jgi:RNA polymerase sigma factor (sigma-70 family)
MDAMSLFDTIEERVISRPAPAEMVLSEQDSQDLVTYGEFLRGDDKAFLRLYTRYESSLLLYCRKMCADSRVAEDSFQETWMHTFEMREKQKELQMFRPFLFRTARNVCLNKLRHEMVRKRGTVELTDDSASVSYQSESEQEELRQLITRALGKLPIAEREVFVLHEYSGFQYNEIAAILGRSDASIKTLAFRARTRLRKVVSSWLGLGEETDSAVHEQLFAKLWNKE